ncbi:DUF3768 domain-containing protein [Alloyangia pacifica]|uniref:DUF3768 domain-containing protein n=1 Tax=Alloyangia pacifica TaxID=311180 RepID=A0A1I6W6Q9_9RHOB|nr:DUF3768 domain-containing protein [Alloyangia pacifica]SDI66007.1 Protein of unknown function [Alloyangia pacifica]SFT21669.1 Protein of unknown function [Alloyangia pacifica]
MAEEHSVSQEQAGNDPEVIVRQVAAANDAIRAAIIRGGHPVHQGRVLCTRGVAEEGLDFVTRAQIAVAAFAEFTEDNDPYGDHTFGAVTIAGKVVWWKIDIFDADYAYGAEDPLDDAQTRRVLTRLFPSEY